MVVAIAVCTLVSSADPAVAGPGRVQPALTVGLLELIGVSPEVTHLGVYVTTSVDVSIKLDDTWTLIPSVGFEFAPELGNWGGVFLLIVDYVLAELGRVALALEPQVGLIHDAAPVEDGFEHHLFVAAGVGLAVVTERFLVIPQVLASVGTDGEGWAVAPTVLFSVPF